MWHIKGVAFLLVGVGYSARDISVLRDGVLDSVRTHPNGVVPLRTVHNALPTGVSAQPKQRVVEFGY